MRRETWVDVEELNIVSAGCYGCSRDGGRHVLLDSNTWRLECE